MNIVLIGYRGTGKSSIGKLLAAQLGREFVDTDVLLVERARAAGGGRTIKEIFEAEGEAGFRDREAAVVADVASRDGLVIAAGGGAVLRAQNVAALRKNGRIIWLQADAATLHRRLAADPATQANRPALVSGKTSAQEIEHLLAVRQPLYQAAADVTVDVSALTLEAAADRVIALVNKNP